MSYTWYVRCILLAGGLGSRLSEETSIRPKPMVEIGGKPILWHLMKYLRTFGIRDYTICLGYKGDQIRDYFLSFGRQASSSTVNLETGQVTYHSRTVEDWRVTLLETGQDTQTGGRIRQAIRFHHQEETFLMTYGDGLANVNIEALIETHTASKVTATVTAVRQPGRFGVLELDASRVAAFAEKPQGDGLWVSGGFFVLESCVADLVTTDKTVWEEEPMQTLTASGQLAAHRHHGFWQPMDTLRERDILEELWRSGRAPWVTWA